MIQDGQFRKLWSLLARGVSLQAAALKTGLDEKTARKYQRCERMSRELSQGHWWRTRPDPFSDVWVAVAAQLKENPGLQAKALFAWLQGEHPGQFQDGQLRTFQRGVRRWWATITGAAFLNSLGGLVERLVYGRAIRRATVPSPLFVLGVPRSGTTHLHNLLSHDPRFAFPDTFQTMNPRIFLWTESWYAACQQSFPPATRPMTAV